MNKNKLILGILMAVLVAVCSAFCGNIPSVFAAENPEQAVEIYVPGTFTGEGTYSEGSTVKLNAEIKWDCDFLYWMEVDSNGNQFGPALSGNNEYTFVADQDIVVSKDADVFIINDNAGNEIKRIKAKWSKVGEFTGEGWYLKGDTATFNASMNPGYEFKSWINGN